MTAIGWKNFTGCITCTVIIFRVKVCFIASVDGIRLWLLTHYYWSITSRCCVVVVTINPLRLPLLPYLVWIGMSLPVNNFTVSMTRFIRLWNSPQEGSFNFRCPCKNLIRIQLIATNLSWLVYFASLMEDELRRKTDTICITMRSRANFKAGMKVARSSGKASSVFGPSLAKQR